MTISALKMIVLTTAAMMTGFAAGVSAATFTDTDQCASCGMVIKKYPGPKGLIVLKDRSVQKFCSARGTACGYAAAMKKSGVVHVFMHDAGATDWKNPDDSKLIDATKAWFVYGSKVKAVMGHYQAKVDKIVGYMDGRGGVSFQELIDLLHVSRAHTATTLKRMEDDGIVFDMFVGRMRRYYLCQRRGRE